MNQATLSGLPDWPGLMDVETATLYLGNKGKVLETLVARDYLEPLTDRHRCRTFRRADLDAALAKAKAAGDPLDPACLRSGFPREGAK